MYVPKHFAIGDREEIFSFIEHNSFGQLISSVNDRPFATHMPFLMADDYESISGHIAKQNPQWENIHEQEVLISLQGPHDYISPSAYNSPGVPTWNYQAVHVYGICRVFNEPERLKVLVESLTDKYEKFRPNPWVADYHEAMLKAIVGLEVSITEIQCKYKVSQNRPEQDKNPIIEQLESNGSNRLANAMRGQK